MRIEAEETTAAELEPGDLFSFQPPRGWELAQQENVNPRAVGEKCYIRIAAPVPDGQEDRTVTRLTVHRTELVEP